MLTYIARRILYSIPVLILSTFFCFAFISLAGDPRQNLLSNPKLSREHYAALAHTYHLDVSIPVRYWYWVKDVFTHKLGSSLLTLQPIWPDITRTMGHTLQVIVIAELIALVLGIAVGIYSAIRQYSVFDYIVHDDQLPRLRDADLLARAAAADHLHRHLPEVERADLLHVGPEQRRVTSEPGRSTGCSTSRCP